MSILKKPVISEKMTKLTDDLGQYSFIVDRHATKNDIRREIEAFYDVKVDRINTMVCSAKHKKNRRTGQTTGRTNIYKKAIFTLKEGHAIDFFESI